MPAVNYDLMLQATIRETHASVRDQPYARRSSQTPVFRLYGPEPAFFQKAWTLSDIQPI